MHDLNRHPKENSMPTLSDTARTARDLHDRILGKERGAFRTVPSPFVRVPLDLVPKAHAKRLTAADKALTAATRTRIDVEDQALDAESDATDERAWRERQSEMAARIASGDTTANVRDILPTYDPAQTLATYETLLYAVKAARAAEADAVKAYDAVVREVAPEILPELVARMHNDAADALVAVEAARVATGRALASRNLAHGLRGVEAEGALTLAGHQGYGRGTHRTTVPDLARSMVATSFAAANVGEAAQSLDTLSGVLQSIANEDPSGPWPSSLGESMPHVAAAVGIQPEAPAPLMTREEYLLLCRRADADGKMRPPMPDHLVR